MLGFEVGLADILADHADAEKLHAAQQAQHAHQTRPARDGIAHQSRDDRPDNADEADDRYRDAEQRDQSNGLHGKARDAVHRKRDHLTQRVVALARHALVALVIDARRIEPDQRHHAAQKQVHFLELRKGVEHLVAEQAVIGMVVHRFGAHAGKKLVERLGAAALERGIGLAARADAVDHLGACAVGLDHLVHGVDVVLAVAVDADGYVALPAHFHQTREQRILVAAVA